MKTAIFWITLTGPLYEKLSLKVQNHFRFVLILKILQWDFSECN